ncbi:selenocysteine-specific translation elongation factor [soil metagenome]
MRSIIVGTAGHIDHGKTSLVRALTGVDADRLPEEKRRGITIDLGFAELDLGDVRIGFVDVPGHERFVKNMLAGAHGLDAVALVVAADEGVMPQTREHFDITRLLGVQAGLIVVTKIDTVDDELLELVRMDVCELVAGSFLEDAPVVAVSSRTGAGLEELKSELRALVVRVPERAGETVARLPVDRAFTMRGFGAVVTGTLIAGEIREGDELELLPAGGRVRVRGVQVHGRAVAAAHAGQRTAINLSGIETGQIERGMTLAHANRLQATQIIDAHVDVLPSAPRPLRSRARARVHLGAAEILARVQVLEEAGEIMPGAGGLIQLRLESPIIALPDERFIIRSYSPQQTIAGGRVLDAHAVKRRGRERVVARDRLSQLLAASRSERAALFIAAAGERGLRHSELAARTGWRDHILDAALTEARGREQIIDADGVYISRENFAELAQAATEAVEAHHRREPLERGLPRETLREQVFAHAAPEVFRAVLSHAEASGTLVSERDIVRACRHQLPLSGADAQLRDRLEQIYCESALTAPTFDEALTRAAGGAPLNREHARKIFQLLLDAGALVRVSPELYFHREAIDKLIGSLREYAARNAADRLIDVAAFKDLAGVSRKYAIPLLEYFDRERITRRAGDRRLIL